MAIQAPPQMEESWKEALKEEWQKPYLSELASFLTLERSSYSVFPTPGDVFNAFCYAPIDQVKVVIIGQDPYHGKGQAHGLSFSVQKGISKPPSLKNIFKELKEDLDIESPTHGCLTSWATQGVLLLNTTLTVREKSPKSHYGKGWEKFTDAVVKKLAMRKEALIFVLWGKAAQEKCQHILSHSDHGHFVLSAAHPSPYSAHFGFFGCKHFSKINELLKRQGKEPINWAINE